MSYALCEYRIPVKIPLHDQRLTASTTKDLVLTLKSFLKEGQAELIEVTEYVGELNTIYDCDSEIKTEGTYFVVSINLDHHQREDWKTFDALIHTKVLAELDSDELHVRTYSENEKETFIAFVRDYD